MRELREAARLDPGNTVFRVSLADALLLHGEPGGAIEQLEAAAAAEPSAPNLRYKLGLLYCMSGHRLHDAMVQLRAAVSLSGAAGGERARDGRLARDEARHALVALLDRRLGCVDAVASVWRRVYGPILLPGDGGSPRTSAICRTPRNPTPQRLAGASPRSPARGAAEKAKVAEDERPDDAAAFRLNDTVLSHHFGRALFALPQTAPSQSAVQHLTAQPNTSARAIARRPTAQIRPTAVAAAASVVAGVRAPSGKPALRVERALGQAPVFQHMLADWFVVSDQRVDAGADETVEDLEEEGDDVIARTLARAPRGARARGGDRDDMTALHFRFGPRRSARRSSAPPDQAETSPKTHPKPMAGGARAGGPDHAPAHDDGGADEESETQFRGLMLRLANAVRASGHRSVQGIKEVIVAHERELFMCWEPFSHAMSLDEAMMGPQGASSMGHSSSQVQRQRPALYLDEDDRGDAETLAAVLRRRCRSVATQIAEALAFCHSRSIIVNGLSPVHSVLVSPMRNFECKIFIDWGLARCAKAVERVVPVTVRSRANVRNLCPLQQRVGLEAPWVEHAPASYRSPESARHTRALMRSLRASNGMMAMPHCPSEHIVIPLGDAENVKCYTPLVTPATSDNWAWALITLQMHEFGRCWDGGCGEDGAKAFANYQRKARDVAAWQTNELARWAANQPTSGAPALGMTSGGDQGTPQSSHFTRDDLARTSSAVDLEEIVRRSRLSGSRVAQLSTFQELVTAFPLNTAGSGGNVRHLWQQIRGGLQRVTMSPELERAVNACLSNDFTTRPSTMNQVLDMMQAPNAHAPPADPDEAGPHDSDTTATVDSLHVARMLNRIGEALETHGACTRQAAAEFKAATEVEPSFADALSNLARTQYVMREYANAADSFAKLAELVPLRQKPKILLLVDDCLRKHRFHFGPMHSSSPKLGGTTVPKPTVSSATALAQKRTQPASMHRVNPRRIACSPAVGALALPEQAGRLQGRSNSTPILRSRMGSPPPVGRQVRSLSNGSNTRSANELAPGNSTELKDEALVDGVSGMRILRHESQQTEADGKAQALVSRLILLDNDEEGSTLESTRRAVGPIDADGLERDPAETARTPSPRECATTGISNDEPSPHGFPKIGRREPKPPLSVADATAQTKSKPHFLSRERLSGSFENKHGSTSADGRNLLKALSHKLGQAVEKMSVGARNLLDRRSSGSNSRSSEA